MHDLILGWNIILQIAIMSSFSETVQNVHTGNDVRVYPGAEILCHKYVC